MADIEMGNMDGQVNPVVTGAAKTFIKAQFVIPEGVAPGSIVAVDHPVTGKCVLCRVPAEAVAGTIVELSFEVEEEEPETRMMTIEVTMPRRGNSSSHKLFHNRNATLLLPDKRKVSVTFPRRAKPGQKYDIKVPAEGVDLGNIEVHVDVWKLYDEETYSPEDQPIVEASMHTGIKFDEMVLVVWRSGDTVFSADMSVIGPALFKFIDKQGYGNITIDDLMTAMDDQKILDYVKSVNCPVLKKLFSPEHRKQVKVFKKINASHSGMINEKEWNVFLRKIQMDRLDFYRKQFLLKNNCYSGRGMEPGEPHEKLFCGAYRGFWDDFFYYSSNNHQLFMTVFVDPIHPYSQRQRIAEFTGCLMSAFFGGTMIIRHTYPKKTIIISSMLIPINH
jgi:hypothetical protein